MTLQMWLDLVFLGLVVRLVVNTSSSINSGEWSTRAIELPG